MYIKTNTMKKNLTIGDEVKWRGSFGNDTPKKAKVTGIEINCVGKYGEDVITADWSKIKGRDSVIDLDNGKWCYGNQITQIR